MYELSCASIDKIMRTNSSIMIMQLRAQSTHHTCRPDQQIFLAPLFRKHGATRVEGQMQRIRASEVHGVPVQYTKKQRASTNVYTCVRWDWTAI